jgi:hypothetical protein
VIRRTRDPDHGHTARLEFLTETGPELRQVALVARESQRAGLEGLSAIQDLAGLGRFNQPFERREGHAPENGVVRTSAAAMEGFDEGGKQRPTVLLVEREEVPQGIDDCVDTAQAIQVPLPKGSCMAWHGAPSTRERESERLWLLGLGLENAHSHEVGGFGGEVGVYRIEP